MLFCKHDVAPVRISIYGCTVTSSKIIDVLGVIFDSKLQWSDQVAVAINKSNCALNAVKITRKLLRMIDLIKLVTSNFYSILFFKSEICVTISCLCFYV